MDEQTEKTIFSSNEQDLEEYKLALADQITELRGRNVPGEMRCRALSECLTCLETAYLWLCQVPGDGVNFAPRAEK